FVGDVKVEEDLGHDWLEVATIKLDFNDPVDQTSALKYIGVVEADLRIDRLARRTYSLANSTSAVWSNGNKTLTMKLKHSDNHGITKLQLAWLPIQKAVKNTSGENLSNPGQLMFET